MRVISFAVHFFVYVQSSQIQAVERVRSRTNLLSVCLIDLLKKHKVNSCKLLF